MKGFQNPFDKSKYLNKTRRTDGTVAEVVVAERIRLWEINALVTDVERIFPIAGFPGVGKTWLFQYFSVGKGKGIYLDLDGFSKADTPQHYLTQVRTRLQQSGRLQGRKNLFFIDHVPPSPCHPNLAKVEEEILMPELDNGALIIIAQQNPDSWCLNLKHSFPYVVQGFGANGRKKLFRKLKISEPKKGQSGYALFDTANLFPGLIVAWEKFQSLTDGELQAVECFMTYWLAQVVPFDAYNLLEELRLVGALTWVNSFLDTERINKILGRLEDKDTTHIIARDKLAHYQCTTNNDMWVEPVRNLLKLWLRQKEPVLASQLDQEIGD